jgi:DNA-directed RNA polymerase subunit RPC12/RpoP
MTTDPDLQNDHDMGENQPTPERASSWAHQHEQITISRPLCPRGVEHDGPCPPPPSFKHECGKCGHENTSQLSQLGSTVECPVCKTDILLLRTPTEDERSSSCDDAGLDDAGLGVWLTSHLHGAVIEAVGVVETKQGRALVVLTASGRGILVTMLPGTRVGLCNKTADGNYV